MIAVVWQFDVKTGQEHQFEEFLGANGEWTKASRHSRSYLGSSFLRDQNLPTRYLVIEYWSELVASERYRKFRSNAIATLERRRDAMADAVEVVGVFTALNVPERTGPTWSQRSKVSSATGKQPKQSRG
jgi:quinol monooxygenase YgiN